MSDIKFDGQFDEYVSFQADFGVVTSTAAVVDPTVTEDSPNPVASSGIYTFVKDEVSAEKTSRDAAIFAESQERMKGDEDIQRYITSKIEAEESARSSADTDLANSISELSRNIVRTVNHIAPDPDGNVNVEGGSGLVDDVKVNGVSVVTDKVANVAVPTKVSSLENDAGYITESDIPTIPTKTSDLTNDSDFTTKGYVDGEISKIPTPPTKTSQLTNDSGYITSADVPAPYDDTEIREEISGLDDKIKDLELFKFPNVTIIGTPTINNGQISNFSATSYLKFPFLVDFRSQPFEINMAFTTGSNVVQQENIFDSDYGLAFAIRNSRFVIAISTNGTSWDLGEGVGTLTVQPNTTYYIKIAWNGSQYVLYYSFDGVSYTPDITKAGTAQPYPKQIYIGVGENFASVVNHFGGTINLNNANLKVNGEVFWSGMDDAGISTRADVSLSNIDADGEAKIKEVAETDSIKASLNNKIEDSALTPLRDNISTLTSQMASKQNKLTAGTNIIIENDVISASGTVSAVDDVARAGVTEVKDTLNGLSETTTEIIKGGYINQPFSYIEDGYVDKANGNIISYNGWKYTDFIEVTERKVRFTTTATSGTNYNAYYDSNKNFIKIFDASSGNVTLDDNVKYIRLSCKSTDNQTISYQVEGLKDKASIVDLENEVKYTFKMQSAIPNGTDLNDVIKEGFYNMGSGNTYLNCPVESGVRSLAVFTQPNSGAIRQIFYDFGNTVIYYRAWSGGTWTAWGLYSDPYTVKRDVGKNSYRKMIDHGGFWAKAIYEDSPKAFIDSATEGVIYHNIDICFSSDGKPFVSHDDTLTDINGSTFRISQSTYTQIKTHTIGDSDYSWVPQTLLECYKQIKKLGGCLYMVDVTPTGNSATDILNAGYLADYYQINHIKADFTNFDDVASRNAFISNASDKYGVYAVIGGSTAQSDLTDYISYIRSHSDRKFAINFEYSTTKSIIENYLSTLNELDINLFVGVFTANTTYRDANIWWADGVLSERNNLNYDDWRLNSKY